MFALDPQALDEAARRIGVAAASVSCLDVAGPFRAAGEGLPGSETTAACRWTATGLDAALDSWAEHLVGLCETARRVALDAVETDEAVADLLRTDPP